LAAAAAAAAKEGEQQQQQQQQAGAAGDSNSGAGLVAGPAAADFVRKDIPHMPDAPLSHLKRLNELMKGLVEQVGGDGGTACVLIWGGGECCYYYKSHLCFGAVRWGRGGWAVGLFELGLAVLLGDCCDTGGSCSSQSTMLVVTTATVDMHCQLVDLVTSIVSD
jgi:hypothetical protein